MATRRGGWLLGPRYLDREAASTSLWDKKTPLKAQGATALAKSGVYGGGTPYRRLRTDLIAASERPALAVFQPRSQYGGGSKRARRKSMNTRTLAVR